MNERIKQLAEQAKKHSLDAMIKIADKEQALKVYSESYDTKFAELIVQECASRLVDMDQQVKGQHNYYKHASIQVLLHFGIQP
jgi:hypothetical protein